MQLVYTYSVQRCLGSHFEGLKLRLVVIFPSQVAFVCMIHLQDTLDESHWKNLNKSLHRVSSTTDGKYDAMKEIEVLLLLFIPLRL